MGEEIQYIESKNIFGFLIKILSLVDVRSIRSSAN